jgi:predicted transcriptional regulator
LDITTQARENHERNLAGELGYVDIQGVLHFVVSLQGLEEMLQDRSSKLHHFFGEFAIYFVWQFLDVG